ncbi:hypothetical protein J4419_05185 [Candidatus Woesearchaeota archaeon]|nr:hypothetical protein [Candidatus Woesearchaeota archaeon]
MDFKKNLEKYNDAYVAMLMTSKRFHHSSMRITAFHYIQEFSTLDIEKYQEMKLDDILREENKQRRLAEFGFFVPMEPKSKETHLLGERRLEVPVEVCAQRAESTIN